MEGGEGAAGRLRAQTCITNVILRLCAALRGSRALHRNPLSILDIQRVLSGMRTWHTQFRCGHNAQRYRSQTIRAALNIWILPSRARLAGLE